MKFAEPAPFWIPPSPLFAPLSHSVRVGVGEAALSLHPRRGGVGGGERGRRAILCVLLCVPGTDSSYYSTTYSSSSCIIPSCLSRKEMRGKCSYFRSRAELPWIDCAPPSRGGRTRGVAPRGREHRSPGETNDREMRGRDNGGGGIRDWGGTTGGLVLRLTPCRA